MKSLMLVFLERQRTITLSVHYRHLKHVYPASMLYLHWVAFQHYHIQGKVLSIIINWKASTCQLIPWVHHMIFMCTCTGIIYPCQLPLHVSLATRPGCLKIRTCKYIQQQGSSTQHETQIHYSRAVLIYSGMFTNTCGFCDDTLWNNHWQFVYYESL